MPLAIYRDAISGAWITCRNPAGGGEVLYQTIDTAAQFADAIRRSEDRTKIFYDCHDRPPVGEFLDSELQETRRSRSFDITGFACDEYGDSYQRYCVVRVRHAKGADYVPVTWGDDYGGATMHLTDAVRVSKGQDEDSHADAMREALYAAYAFAEREAEEEFEYQRRHRLEQDIETLQGEIEQFRGEARELCAALRRVKELRRNVSAAVRTIKLKRSEL